MNHEDIKTIGVIGAGQMGSGIAQVFAQIGKNVILNDIKPEFVERGLSTIGKNFDRKLKKCETDEQKAAIEANKAEVLGRIKGTTELTDMKDADFVVEAAIEDLTLKIELFRKLDEICGPEVILASNTSSISITTLAGATGRQERFIGMHFMNPVPVMKLVEIIRGIATDDSVYKVTEDLALALKKSPVEVNDSPGFVSNRVLLPMINEAAFCLFEGIAKEEHIDTVMKLGMNHPMGPLTLADFIGLDTCLSILNVLYDGFKDPKYRPCPLFKKYVDAGWLGRKSGRGFYKY